jgi:hypothetical protein
MWITKPEVIYSTVLFLIALLATLYPAKIKALFGLTVYKLKRNKLKQLKLEDLQNQLLLLERLKGNTYGLLAWTMFSLVGIIRNVLWIFIFCGSASGIVILIWGKPLWPIVATVVTMPIAFGLGSLQVLYATLKGLHDYDNTTAKLKESIARLRRELGLEPVETSVPQLK